MMTNEAAVLSHPRPEPGLDLISALVEEEARVARAEAALAAARERLFALQVRLGRMEPLSLDELAARIGRPPRARRWSRADDGQPSMRSRILERMAASPGEVFTPAVLAPLVEATSRDSVRNTLLVLHAKGRIEKVGPGRYRAVVATM